MSNLILVALKLRQRNLLIIFLSISLGCWATDLKPWFGNDYEVEFRGTLLYQNYNSISTSCTCRHRHNNNNNDIFATFSAAYPFKRFSGEFEVTAASTRHQPYNWDNIRITGRYQWMNDIDGDPISLVTGLTVDQCFTGALHDISSFHHGHLEAEAHVAFGKTYGDLYEQGYLYRWWGVLGIGDADTGWVWLRGDVAGEYYYDDRHLFRGFMKTLWGTGHKDLNPRHFDGYGKIQHRSVDLGIRYSYSMDCWGTVSLEYAHRVYAHNFPKDVNLLLFEYYYPFGSQPSCSY